MSRPPSSPDQNPPQNAQSRPAGSGGDSPARQATLSALRALGYNRAPQASRPLIRGRALPIKRAVDESSSLAVLAALSRESQARLLALQRLLPPLLWAQLSAGPVEGDSWCVLVSNNAVGAKLRQWLPAIAAHLRTHGWNVQTIRIKVRSR
jgi:hypothetical protein